jgi:hypothetical protein
VASGLVEQFLIERIGPRLAERWMLHHSNDRRVFEAVEHARVAADEITVQINPASLAAATGREGEVLRLPFHIQRKRGAQVIGAVAPEATPSIDRVLVRGLVLAQRWARELEFGEVPSISALAQREGMCSHYAARLLPLAYLAPDLVERIITGRQPRWSCG